MKPYTHIGTFPHTLKRFATYLQSQHIKYTFYQDYDGEYIYPVNSKYFFGVSNNTLTRYDKSFKSDKLYLPYMPIREEIIG
jgi:hypothetical protein